MPRDITVTFADGTQHIYRGAPDNVTPDAVRARAEQEFSKPISALDGGRKPRENSMAENIAMGAARGVKDVIDTGAEFLASGFDKLAGTQEGERVRQMNEAGKKEFEQSYGDSTAATVSRVGGNIVATLPVGPVLGAGARAAGMTRLGNALASGGMSTGATVVPGLAAKTADMGIRMAGGAGTGYATAGLINPDSAEMGAIVGAAIPPGVKAAGAIGDAVVATVRPFTRKGQEKIATEVLRNFSTNPQASANLLASREVIPGSLPTSVMAAGDEGLAGLSRTLQSADSRYAAELSARQSAQNAARTAALEDVAGNTGKLALAREAREAATAPMREAVLDGAGRLPARPVLDSIDRLIAKPDNAGKMAQGALNEVRNRIAQFAPDGQIDARALYAIRKDINDTLGGKLQGEAGNLKLASGQLIEIKALIDDAIDQASRAVPMSSERALMPAGANIERVGAAAPYGSQAPRSSWAQYLGEYSQRSIPINQMEKLEEVLKAVSTGSVDKNGNAILSAAKLNNLMRNRAQDLQKVLAPEQLDLLRRLAADLNASQLATNSGRAVGSNTVQNLAQTNMLASLMGNRLAGSAASQSALARLLQVPYGSANKMIQERIGNALLNPQEAVRLLEQRPRNALLEALEEGSARLGYRSAPVISAQ